MMFISKYNPRLILILILLLCIGSFFRFFNLSDQAYWVDESITITNVLSIQEKGVSTFYSGNYYSCPLYCYPTAFIASIFGNTAASYRFEAALFGVLFILVIFAITRRIFNEKIALLSTFFVTFSYWQIAWSRQARWYTLFECFFWLAIFFFYLSRSSSNKKVLYTVLTIVFTLLAMVAHPLSYLLPIIFLGWILFDEIWKNKTAGNAIILWKKILSYFIAVAAIFLISDHIFKVGLFSWIGNSIQISNLFPYYVNFYLHTYWLFMPFCLASIATIFTKQTDYKTQTLLLLSILASYFAAASFLTNDLNYGHLFQITPIFYLLGTRGMFFIHEKIQTTTLKIAYWTILLGLFFTIGGGVLVPKEMYFLENDNPRSRPPLTRYSVTAQADWNAAYEYILSRKKNDEVVISSVPQFNKIFLNDGQYWLKFETNNPTSFEKDGRDVYVGAITIRSLEDLQRLMQHKRGYVVFEKVYGNSNINSETILFIERNLSLLFRKKTDTFLEIFVYKF